MKKALYIAIAAAVIYAVAFLFYRNHILALFFTPLSLTYPSIRRKQEAERNRKELSLQFKDMLYSLSSSISAGKTIEAALRDVQKDLAVLYPGAETSILLEIEIMLRRLEMNETLEAVIAEFAERTDLDDIRHFSDVFRISKRSGANLVEVIRNTTSIINDKLEIMQEIDMMLAERRFEQRVLNIMPVLMILLLSLTAPDYLEPVFKTTAGMAVMTVSIGLLVLAWFISKKITGIRI